MVLAHAVIAYRFPCPLKGRQVPFSGEAGHCSWHSQSQCFSQKRQMCYSFDYLQLAWLPDVLLSAWGTYILY